MKAVINSFTGIRGFAALWVYIYHLCQSSTYGFLGIQNLTLNLGVYNLES